MNGREIERPVTPRQGSPRQNPTPQTPEPLARPCLSYGEPDLDLQDTECDWRALEDSDMARYSEGELRCKFKSALRHIRQLESTNATLKAQASHFRFNYEMLVTEQEERSRKLEVEHLLYETNQDILFHKLHRSTEDEQVFRNRHLKAKKRVAELSEDTRRQQLSIDHLRRALSSRTDTESPRSHSDLALQRDGGLEVLSDAAGLAQMRDQSSAASSSGTHHTSILQSPLVFESISQQTTQGQQQAPMPATPKRRRGSQEVESREVSGFKTFDDRVDPASLPGRHLTFTSSQSPVDHNAREMPMTPRSPRRRRSKLEPSALS